MRKLTEKKQINTALWVIECPGCGDYLASASERGFLPEYSYCKKCSSPEYKIYQEGEREVIEKFSYPRLKGSIGLTEIEDIELMDKAKNAEVLARALRETGEYLASLKTKRK